MATRPRFIRLFPALATMLLVVGYRAQTVSAQASSEISDSAAIAAVAAAFSRAYERGDAAAMTALYTPDAVIFPDRSEAIAGAEAIQRYWTHRPGNRVTRHVITPTALFIHGNVAYDYGIYEVSGTEDGKPWGPASGKYVMVWRRGTDGQWRMHLDIWNRRAPPA